MTTAAKKMILSSWCDIPFNQLVISRRTSAGSFGCMIVAAAATVETQRLAIASSNKQRTPSCSSKMSLPRSARMRSPSNSRKINASTRGPAGNGGRLFRLGRSL